MRGTLAPLNMFGALDQLLWPVRNMEGFNPSTEITKEDDTLLVRMDLPGIELDDINITLENSRLSISGERKETREEENQTRKFSEISYGYFRREFQLPRNVSDEDIEASYDKGVLSLRIRTPQEEPAKKITVKTDATRELETEGAKE